MIADATQAASGVVRFDASKSDLMAYNTASIRSHRSIAAHDWRGCRILEHGLRLPAGLFDRCR